MSRPAHSCPDPFEPMEARIRRRMARALYCQGWLDSLADVEHRLAVGLWRDISWEEHAANLGLLVLLVQAMALRLEASWVAYAEVHHLAVDPTDGPRF